jgi:hypothetical protein
MIRSCVSGNDFLSFFITMLVRGTTAVYRS